MKPTAPSVTRKATKTPKREVGAAEVILPISNRYQHRPLKYKQFKQECAGCATKGYPVGIGRLIIAIVLRVSGAIIIDRSDSGYMMQGYKTWKTARSTSIYSGAYFVGT